MFEIRWIDESKRYGLFATQRIDRGTEIFHELAVIGDVSKLAEHVHLWNSIKAEVTLDKTAKSDVATQTQHILHGMRNLDRSVKTNRKYRVAMKIHRARIESGDVVEHYEEGVFRPISYVPMNLYKQTVGVDVAHSSEDAILVILRDSLCKINTYLQGIVGVHSLDARPQHLTAWGPHSSLINHGCRPNAATSMLASFDPRSTLSRNIGVIALRSLAPIETGEEITIEYTAAFGSFQSRRQQLRFVGINKCHCRDCDCEESLILQPGDAVAQQKLARLSNIGRALFRIKHYFCPNIKNLSPVSVYYHLFHTLNSMNQHEYYGGMLPYLNEIAMEYAKHHNDNIRAYWFAHWLIMYSELANGKEHPHTRRMNRNVEAALSNRVWNEQKKELLVLCDKYPFSESDARLMFTLDHDPDTTTHYPQLTITNGRPTPISFEDNLTLVTATLSQQKSEHTMESAAASAAATALAAEQEHHTQAQEEADRAASELAAEEDKEAAKKVKAKQKKKEKQARTKEKKRRKSLAATATATATATASASASADEKTPEQQTVNLTRTSTGTGTTANEASSLTARIAAVRTAVTVPALPLTLPRPLRLLHHRHCSADTVKAANASETSETALTVAAAAVAAATASQTPAAPPLPIPYSHRFRSFSNPEPATVIRFFTGTPLRVPAPTYADEDCVSENGLDIRFGVSIRQEMAQEKKCEYVGWYLAKK